MGTTATVVTHNQKNLDISAVPTWFSWDFDFNNDLNSGNAAIDLLSLPVGAIIHDQKIVCNLAQTNGTTFRIQLMLETLTTIFYVGTADNGSSLITDVVEAIGHTGFPLAAVDTLQAKYTITGDAMDLGPKFRVSALISRTQRP